MLKSRARGVSLDDVASFFILMTSWRLLLPWYLWHMWPGSSEAARQGAGDNSDGVTREIDKLSPQPDRDASARALIDVRRRRIIFQIDVCAHYKRQRTPF